MISVGQIGMAHITVTSELLTAIGELIELEAKEFLSLHALVPALQPVWEGAFPFLKIAAVKIRVGRSVDIAHPESQIVTTLEQLRGALTDPTFAEIRAWTHGKIRVMFVIGDNP